jgi:PAS domain S-box
MPKRTIEDKLREQEEQLGVLDKDVDYTTFVVNPDTGRYTYVSPSIKKIRGYTSEEAMNLSLKDHIAPESYSKAISMIVTAISDYEQVKDDRQTVELEMYHKDGHSIWMEVTSRIIKEHDGALKIIGVSKDITKRKVNTNDRVVLIQQLNQAMEEQKKLQEEQKRLQNENKMLRGLLPICSTCKKIRDEDGLWWALETYISSHSEAKFSHTYCPKCKDVVLKEIKEIRK